MSRSPQLRFRPLLTYQPRSPLVAFHQWRLSDIPLRGLPLDSPPWLPSSLSPSVNSLSFIQLVSIGSHPFPLD